jgi:hypothetical protein
MLKRTANWYKSRVIEATKCHGVSYAGIPQTAPGVLMAESAIQGKIRAVNSIVLYCSLEIIL